MYYRSEIDGLRAIAVLAVVIFHINPTFLPGGFIGVDIFFVISGFLITKIIFKQINDGEFNLSNFYLKRIKRLLPLFFSVAIVSLILGYFLLYPSIYKVLSRDVIASNLFLANVMASISGNYFDADKVKPLLHLWSLAVEEQFYIIFPTLFLVLFKFLNRYKLFILLILFLSSLMLAEWMSATPRYAHYSYFLLPTRMWELLAGCILAIVQPNPIKKYNIFISYLGVVFIILGLVLINENSVFPGLITLLPIVGSLLIIIAGNKGFGYLLSSKIILFIGVISYSMYMWHWPLIIFYKVIYPDFQFHIISGIVFIASLIFISHLSKKYIEDYFRFKKIKSGFLVIWSYLLIPTILLVTLSLFIYFSKGIPSRYNVDEKINVTSTVKCPALTVGCFITNNKSTDNQVLLLGDSHAQHFANLFGLWFDQNNLSLKLYSSGGCNFYSDEVISPNCENVKEELRNVISKSKTIIIAKRSDNLYKDEKFLQEFTDYINALTHEGHNIILIKQVPKFLNSGFLEKWMQARRYGFEFVDKDFVIDENYKLSNSILEEKFKDNKQVYILDFNDILTPNGVVLKYDEKGIPIYYNSNHLTAYGAEWIYQQIKNNKDYNWVLDLIKK